VSRHSKIIWIKPAVWIACLAPVFRLAHLARSGGLGANPIEFVTLSTGTWALVFLLTTLAITPLRIATGWNAATRLRRLLGLFSFFYATLHFITYIWLDKFFDVADMISDIGRRPFITAGFAAFVLMVPLAATSTAGAIRLLGGRGWRMLHRLIYLCAAAAAVHFWWKVKADIRGPAIYGVILAVLLGFRIAVRLLRKPGQAGAGRDQAASPTA
jgi:sulfoxide reductase heme-binding subunit YedZ